MAESRRGDEMAIEQQRQHELLVRRAARKFAHEVKESNMALKLPDNIIDWLKDEDIEPFKEYLKSFGLVQRKQDYRWERAE